MILSNLNYKIKRRTWSRLVGCLRNKDFYPKIYRSYWHGRLHRPRVTQNFENFFTAVPNPGAGIGHQLANWIAGYWYAEQFGLQFAHTPFSKEKWEKFLGFGEDEVTAKELVGKFGYRKVILPLFDEKNDDEIGQIRKIIHSYDHRKVLFVAEQDQFYRDQFGVMEDLKRKFRHASARQNDHLVYSKSFFNIAIHVRRGDVFVDAGNVNPNLLLRWQDNNYFEKVLTRTLEALKTEKPVAIYLFSQGERKDFPEFEQYENFHFCLDMSSQDSFLHMVNADLLITSKSSFSYKPALLSDGIKVCPENFWHGYPQTSDWILVKDDGSFDAERINSRYQR